MITGCLPGFDAFLRRMAFFVRNTALFGGNIANFTPVAHLRHPFGKANF
jgi:xanthine dehydrogenase iron-sulfur cluster and FAD-binding subunit A